ncbi:MAG: hypothetical protein WCP68_11430 [Enhydrobacter sp.]
MKRHGTPIVCIAALAAAVIAGRILLVEFFPEALQLFASALP